MGNLKKARKPKLVKKAPYEFISHRGNLDGPEPSYENSPDYVGRAIDKGYRVEVDVWVRKNPFDGVSRLYLGHDGPLHHISISWLLRNGPRLVLHIKDPEVFNVFWLEEPELNYFCHTLDPFTVTSKGEVWIHDWARCLFKTPRLRPRIIPFMTVNELNWGLGHLSHLSFGDGDQSSPIAICSDFAPNHWPFYPTRHLQKD